VQLNLSLEDISNAPSPVKAWFAERLAIVLEAPVVCQTIIVDRAPPVEPQAPKAEKPAKPVAPEKPAEPEVTADAVMAAAQKLIDARGAESLGAVVREMGITRVRDCPPERRAELLAKLAVE
jgi:hypothetical protein